MQNNLYLSIIIPTIGRKDDLRNLLNSIVNSKLNIKYEVIVIDQNKDLIDDIIEEFKNLLPIFNHKVNFIGLSKAKNYGAFVASGNIVCFPDDDAEFCTNTIDIALKYLFEKRADCVFGKCVDKNTGMDSICKFETNETFLNLHNFEGRFVEATMFTYTKLIKEYPFDENMGAGTLFGSQEGYDLVYRLLSDGKKLFYSPCIVFYHPNKVNSKSTKDEIKRAFFYSCGFGYLCKKHNLIKKFKKRFRIIRLTLPFIYFIMHRKFKYYKAQYMGMYIGYVCL